MWRARLQVLSGAQWDLHGCTYTPTGNFCSQFFSLVKNYSMQLQFRACVNYFSYAVTASEVDGFFFAQLQLSHCAAFFYD